MLDKAFGRYGATDMCPLHHRQSVHIICAHQLDLFIGLSRSGKIYGSIPTIPNFMILVINGLLGIWKRQ